MRQNRTRLTCPRLSRPRTAALAWAAVVATAAATTATITRPTTAHAAERYADTSYWIKSHDDRLFRPFLQLGWRGIHASTGNKLPSNIEAEAQLGTWIAGPLGLYAFGAQGLIRNTSTTVGAGLKLRLYSTPAGGPEFFLSGLNVCATAEVARLD